MYEYQLSVGQDGETKERLIVIQSGAPIEGTLLQIAGLLLDGGYDQETIDEMRHLAAAFVSVTGMEPEDFVERRTPELGAVHADGGHPEHVPYSVYEDGRA